MLAACGAGAFAVVAMACGSFSSDDTAAPSEAGAPDGSADSDGGVSTEASTDARMPRCDGGVCPPMTLITNEKGPRRFVVRGGSVYWALVGGTIRTCVADNCSSTARS